MQKVKRKVEILKRFGGRTSASKKWVSLWNQIGQRICSLPEEQQQILLSDIHTAILNRIIVFEQLQDKRRNNVQ